MFNIYIYVCVWTEWVRVHNVGVESEWAGGAVHSGGAGGWGGSQGCLSIGGSAWTPQALGHL